jgi:dethiobiotin synthetase
LGVQRLIVITGTDTGVGKTVLTALLASHLRASGLSVAALKPICSGRRDDARVLHRALRGALKLDDINPWHFRAALTPLLAARKEREHVELREVVAHVHALSRQFQLVLVEGAGGLLSPLGEHFSTRELIGALGAEVIIVARNQLGVVNHVRLTLEALPPLIAARARVVLMSPKRSDPTTRTNPDLLAEFIGEAHVSVLPWFARIGDHDRIAAAPKVRAALDALFNG